MEATKLSRRRRTAEERLADLERKRLEVLEKQREMLARIEEQKRRLTNRGAMRKARLEDQKRFENAVQRIAPEWDHRHFIAVIAEAVERGVDADGLAEKGAALLLEHGKSRRGRRVRSEG